MLKITFIAIQMLLWGNMLCFAQSVASIDVVRVKAQYQNEAHYFYTQNWLVFRKAALEEGYISGYDMQQTATDSTGHFILILTTRYADSLSHAKREEHFAPIMKRIAPAGPKMLNTIPRKDFLEYLTGYQTIVMASDAAKQ